MLLPNNFDDLLRDAIKSFWRSRSKTDVTSQEGGRGAVIGGKNLDDFMKLIKAVADHCRFPGNGVLTNGKQNLTIPGYYRPTKMWDALVIHEGRLIAAFELKSHIGSLGNNSNNRAEEAIGSGADFWVANRERAFSANNYVGKDAPRLIENDIRPPFLGYLMLLEDSPESTRPTKLSEDHYKVFPEFEGSSYAKRYQVLCERLVTEKLYSSASLILSNNETGGNDGMYYSPTEALSPRSFFTEFAAKLVATLES
jgi:hypothetical protein